MTIEINLIPHKSKEQRWRKRLAIIAFVLIIVILLGLAYLYIDKIHERHQVKAQLSTLDQKLSALNQEDTIHSEQRLQLQNEVKQLKDKSTHVEALLMTFVDLLPSKSTISTFDFQNETVTLSGTFKGLDGVSQFYHAVQTTDLVSSTDLNKVTQSSGNDYLADFTIRINMERYNSLGGNQ